MGRQRGNREIKAYFAAHDGETIYPSDVADEVRLDYHFVCDLIRELETEGQVAKAE